MLSSVSTLSVITVIEHLDDALEALKPSQSAVLALDADGTLWNGDVGVDIFEALLKERAIRKEAAHALWREAKALAMPPVEDLTEQATLLYNAYHHGLMATDRVCQMMAWAFAGYHITEMRAFAEAVLKKTYLQNRICNEMVSILSWARQRPIKTYVVSASPRAVVEVAVQSLDLAPEQVLAMTPSTHDGILLSSLEPPIPYGPGKVQALRAAQPGAILLGAFGDNALDVEMLQEARVAVAVRPKHALLARAQEIKHLMQLATA